MTKKRSKTLLDRINKSIEITNYAIKHKISVKEASVKCGFSNTYVKNVKSDIYRKFEGGNLAIKHYDTFKKVYDEYVRICSQPTIKNPESTKITLPIKISEPNKPNDIPNSGQKETFKSDGNVAECEWVGGSNYPNDHVKTLDQLLITANVDTNEWKVRDHIINKWDTTSWKSGSPQTVQNWQVKARLERDVTIVREKIVGEIFKEMISEYEPPIYDWIPETPIVRKEKNLLEISIFDLHIGKLAWGGETFENYDVKIARKRFLGSISKLMQHATGFNYERILFPIGNDFFNSDTMLNTTTKGTPQDEDLRWQKTFKVGVKLLVDAINLLKQSGVPVDVVVIPGNHDFERSYYMGEYLTAWFNNDASVYINNHASPRKYYNYGNLLLGLTHGSEEKESSLPLLMATDIESKPYWSTTKFHEWHLGHIHRKRTVQYDINKSRLLNEDLGVTIRYLSSLTGTEEWHHKKGYVGSTKAADGFIWNYEHGLVAHLNTNIIIN